MKAAITAIGGYVPEYVLTNSELESRVDTNDEWITTRTGIKERRILKPEEGYIKRARVSRPATNRTIYQRKTLPPMVGRSVVFQKA